MSVFIVKALLSSLRDCESFSKCSLLGLVPYAAAVITNKISIYLGLSTITSVCAQSALSCNVSMFSCGYDWGLAHTVPFLSDDRYTKIRAFSVFLQLGKTIWVCKYENKFLGLHSFLWFWKLDSVLRHKSAIQSEALLLLHWLAEKKRGDWCRI